MHPPTHPTEKKLTHLPRLLGSAPEDWALHPKTGLFTRRLSFAPDDWALHPTTGLCNRLLGFATDDWALQPTTGLCTSTTGLSSEYRAFDPNLKKANIVQTNVLSQRLTTVHGEVPECTGSAGQK